MVAIGVVKVVVLGRAAVRIAAGGSWLTGRADVEELAGVAARATAIDELAAFLRGAAAGRANPSERAGISGLKSAHGCRPGQTPHEGIPRFLGAGVKEARESA